VTVTRRHRVFASLLAGVLVAVTGGCESTKGRPESTKFSLVQEGQLTTCTFLEFQPFQFKRNDKIVGFDVDLVDFIAKDMGLPQKILDVSFELISSGEALNQQECDLAAAAITINDERLQLVNFSNPYFSARQALLVRKNSNITSFDQLRGKKLAVQKNTTTEDYAATRGAGINIVQFEAFNKLVDALKAGDVDAALNDNGPALSLITRNPDLAIVQEIETNDKYALAVRKGNEQLLERVNRALKKLEQSGDYEKLYEKWFGRKPA
jgi:polar amino acid transport system substrate-binding protein